MNYTEPATWTWPDAYDDDPPEGPTVAMDTNDEDRRRLISEILSSLLWSWNND